MKLSLGQKQMSKNAGFSLIELMVAMVLSIILLAGVIDIYINTKQTYNTQEGLSRIQENARFVMGRLTRELSTAGYLGCLGSIDAEGERVINTLGDKTKGYDLESPVIGKDGTGSGSSDEITIIRANGASAVAVSKPLDSKFSGPLTLDFNDPDYSDLKQYDVVTVADCEKVATFMITNVPGGDGVIQHATGVTAPKTSQFNATTDLEHPFGHYDKTPATILAIKSVTYSIGDSAAGTCSVATPGFCALFENGTELVEGVEDLQFEYGVDTNNDTDVDVYRDASAVTTADWAKVVSVRVTIRLNEVSRVPGSANGITSNNPKTYSSVVRLRSRGV